MLWQQQIDLTKTKRYTIMLKPMIPSNYRELCIKKWAPVLESKAFDSIQDRNTLIATAMLLENTSAEFERKFGSKEKLVEAVSAGNGGMFGTTGDYSPADARIPSLVLPTIRRAFPNLIAHNIVGVQPMTGPVGFAFGLRSVYDAGGKGSIPQGTELGYNYVDVAFSGASADAPTLSGDAGEAWAKFAGTDPTVGLSTSTAAPHAFVPQGTGAAVGDAEYWKFGSTMPTVSFKMIKETITAESRKLGANWSLEVEEDMAAMQGLDARSEFAEITSYELQQAIDRELVGRIVKSGLDAGNVSSWSPVTADGRNQQERIGTFYTEMIRRANDVAVRSRRGAANFAFGSPNVCSIFSASAFNPNSSTGFKASENGLLTTNGVAKVGTFVNGGITLYRDTFANGDYLVLGYKGQAAYDSGIIYCPYIPLQLKEIPGSDDLNPRMLMRTRYGITKNILAAGNYYHVINVKELNSELVNDNGTAAGRKFFA